MCHTGVSASFSYALSRQALFTSRSLLALTSSSVKPFSGACSCRLPGSWKRLVDSMKDTLPVPTMPILSVGLLESCQGEVCGAGVSLFKQEFTGSLVTELSGSDKAASSSATRCSSRCVYDRVGDLPRLSIDQACLGCDI